MKSKCAKRNTNYKKYLSTSLNLVSGRRSDEIKMREAKYKLKKIFINTFELSYRFEKQNFNQGAKRNNLIQGVSCFPLLGYQVRDEFTPSTVDSTSLNFVRGSRSATLIKAQSATTLFRACHVSQFQGTRLGMDSLRQRQTHSTYIFQLSYRSEKR